MSGLMDKLWDPGQSEVNVKTQTAQGDQLSLSMNSEWAVNAQPVDRLHRRRPWSLDSGS